MSDKVAASQENNEGVTEDGIEDAFEVGAFKLNLKEVLTGFNICPIEFCLYPQGAIPASTKNFVCLFFKCAGPGRDPGDC